MTRDEARAQPMRHVEAIALLMSKVAELERKAEVYKMSINVLCEDDGLPLVYPDIALEPKP